MLGDDLSVKMKQKLSLSQFWAFGGQKWRTGFDTLNTTARDMEVPQR